MMPDDDIDDLDDIDGLALPSAVEDTDDGGALLHFDDDDADGAAPSDSGFYDNLAEPEANRSELSRLSSALLDLIEKDKEARKPRDKQQQEGMMRTGLGDEAPGGASFAGASRVVHPMLVEACIDFASRTMRELFPSQGPVRDRIDGRIDARKLAKARRKSALMNWQLTVQQPAFRSELEQLLTQVPLGGGQYMKVTWDVRRNRPDPLFVAIDDMLLPYAATNFYTAQRRTHVQYLTELDYRQRVSSGMYIDVDLPSPSMEPEQTASGQSADRIEGRAVTGFNEDGQRTVYETQVCMDMDLDDATEGVAPYIVSIDLNSRQVLSVYRNWEEGDESRAELAWFVEWPFIPWRGAYPLGLPHIIGGLSGAATGALRALLDSAHINNAPTAVRLKGRLNGQNVALQPTEIAEVEAPINVNDIRQVAMPIPFNQPSPVLYELLGFLTNLGKGVVRTSLDDLGDGNPNVPVGTTMARIEQGLIVYSSVFGRLHDSMARLLRILDRLNARNLDEEKLKAEAGELLATREDFEGPFDIAPVSDPNIFSEVQRIAQVQTVAQRAAAQPQLYNQRKVEVRILETLKVLNPEDLLNPQAEPKHQNAVNENVAASLGRPVTAFPTQDHLAHLRTHLEYLTNPMLGMDPTITPTLLPIILGHAREHVSLWYASRVFELASAELGRDLGDMLREMQEDEDADGVEEEGKALDAALSEAGSVALLEANEVLQPYNAVIAQAHQMLQQMQPQPQPDPSLAILQGDLQRKAARDAQDAQIAAQRDAIAARKDALEAHLALQKMASEERKNAEDNATRRAVNTEDNQTAMAIAAAEIQSGESVSLSTGSGINP